MKLMLCLFLLLGLQSHTNLHGQVLYTAATMYANNNPAQSYHLVYSSFHSKNNTNYAEDKLSVTIVSSDSIKVNEYYFFKKEDKFFKEEAGRDYLYILDNETFIIQDKDMRSWFSYYTKDAAKAKRLIAQKYAAKVEHDKIEAVRDDYENNKTSKIVTNYIKSNPSKRNDPALEKAIAKWWNTNEKELSPIQNIYIIIPNYEVITEYGVIVRKAVDALIVYKYSDKKCYLQWRSFGYQYLGGGVYDKELQSWYQLRNGDYYSLTIGNKSTGSMYIKAGHNYEVTCEVKK